MTRNRQDAAPRRGAGRRTNSGTPAGREPLSAAQVIAYLQRHPDFLNDHPDVIDALAAPARRCGDGVTDLQQVMVERLRRENSDLAETHDALVVTGRSNLCAQSRIHNAVVTLLSARTFEHFVEMVTSDLAITLDIDVVTIGVEQLTQDQVRAETPGVYRLPPGAADRIFTPGQSIILRGSSAGDPTVFGVAAGLVRSEALIRLTISRSTPPALLALGSRRDDQFQPGQGTELLSFLARVIETSIRGWLNLPD